MHERDLTIIIPTYNESKYISRTLLEIAKQINYHNVRIIVSDANSTDDTRDIVKSVAKHLKLHVDIINGGLPSIGRNAGAAIANTKYVLFLDADITFTHRYAIHNAMASIDKYDMISTNPIYNGETDIRAWLMFKINKYLTLFMSKFNPFAIGAFTLVRLNKFHELKGYDINAYQSEDWLLSKQIDPSKFKIIPDLITQDNRRFKRYGYWSMIKMMYLNWINRDNTQHFYKDNGYWK